MASVFLKIFCVAEGRVPPQDLLLGLAIISGGPWVSDLTSRPLLRYRSHSAQARIQTDSEEQTQGLFGCTLLFEDSWDGEQAGIKCKPD